MVRTNNVNNMTIVEQIIKVKEETCTFACMFLEYVNDEYEDEEKRKEVLKGYCVRCPLNNLHFSDVSGSNPEHLLGT